MNSLKILKCTTYSKIFSMATTTTTAPSTNPTPKVSVALGPIIIGAGPSGLAVAASLRRLSVPFVILERSDGIADLWRSRTYDRLSLHLPKQFCHLPHLPFPPQFPTYPSKSQFLAYLLAYAERFSLHPLFNHEVVSARFDATAGLWRVTAIESQGDVGDTVVEFVSAWVVVATGENAEIVVPEVKGREGFKGGLMHSSEYKSGREYKGKKVLVVGCGNSGMEMCLDLCEHGALPFMSVRGGVSKQKFYVLELLMV